MEHLRRRTARAAARRAATSASSPPTITLSSPDSALTRPPDTGASTKPTPAAAQRSCSAAHDVRRVGREVDDARRSGIGGEHAAGADDGRLDVGRAGQRQEHARARRSAASARRRRRRRAARPRAIAYGERSNTRTSWPAATRWRRSAPPSSRSPRTRSPDAPRVPPTPWPDRRPSPPPTSIGGSGSPAATPLVAERIAGDRHRRSPPLSARQLPSLPVIGA